MTEKLAISGTFNRCCPLLERRYVPCEFITFGINKNGAAGTNSVISKRRESLTLRIFEGHRSHNDGGEIERAIRLELSDEYRREVSNHTRKQNVERIPSSPNRDSRRHDQVPSSMIEHFSPKLSNNVQPSLHPPNAYNMTSEHKNNNYHYGEASNMDSSLVQLYELEVGESDFMELQQDQALLVDFSNFSKSFIDLLWLCDLGKDDDQVSSESSEFNNNKKNTTDKTHTFNPLLGCQLSASSGMIGQSRPTVHNPSQLNHFSRESEREEVISTYTCRIEETAINSWNQKNKLNKNKVVRFSIVESNQFRELTHLSLNLSSGTDASVKSYLSLRLSETLGSIGALKYQLKKENNRALKAEKSCKEKAKSFDELVALSEKEKNTLIQEVDETMQKQKIINDEECQALKERYNRELQELKTSSSKIQKHFESEIDRLQSLNDNIALENTKVKEENQSLKSKLSEHKDESKTLLRELSELHGAVETEKDERNNAECQLKQVKERLSSLEQLNDDMKRLNYQREEQIKSSAQKAHEAQMESESYTIRLHTTEQELNVVKEELSKTQQSLCRFQFERQEMKRRMKSKVDLMQQQEQILASKELKSTEEQEQLEHSQKRLMRMQHEVDMLKKKLNNANNIIDKNKKTLEKKQQILSWLNQEVKDNKNKMSSSYLSATNNSFGMSQSTTFLPIFAGSNPSQTLPFTKRYGSTTTLKSITSKIGQRDYDTHLPQVTPQPTVKAPNNTLSTPCHFATNEAQAQHLIPSAININR